jgi:Lipocalin-like domain
MTTVFGTWRLVRAVSRDKSGNALSAPYGGHPTGRVVLGADGRMMAVTCDGRRNIPGGEKREYSSYCGNYTFDGQQLITRVDASSDPNRLGSDQIRDVRFEDGLMVLRPPARDYGGQVEQRELYWEKIAEV